jgi:hypothetical protein
MATKPVEEEVGIVHVPETPGGVAPDPKTVQELREEIDKEWGAWKAATPIFVDGVRAFNPGDHVPVANVKAHGYDKDGLVEKV